MTNDEKKPVPMTQEEWDALPPLPAAELARIQAEMAQAGPIDWEKDPS
jgi:hypothetical protein